MQALNIQIFVDVVQLLLDEGTDHSVFMFDDSPCGGDGGGTARLLSPILPGQLVRWTVTPIDVQTPIWISRIEFGPRSTADAHPVAESEGEAIETETVQSITDDVAEEAAPCVATPYSPPVWARSWNGFVPAWSLTYGGEYAYRLVLSFGGAREVAVEGPALVYPVAMPPAEEPAPEDLAATTKEA